MSAETDVGGQVHLTTKGTFRVPPEFRDVACTLRMPDKTVVTYPNGRIVSYPTSENPDVPEGTLRIEPHGDGDPVLYEVVLE